MILRAAHPVYSMSLLKSVLLAFRVLCIAAVCVCCGRTETVITMPSGLQYQILSPGSGPATQLGQTVRIHETTTLRNGTMVFSTRTRNDPVSFELGRNQVIAGVEEGVLGM